MKIVIATIKSWNIERANKLKEKYAGVHDIRVVTQKQELSVEMLEEFEPDLILLPHWSYILPEKITAKWSCVVFHMTDLPFGRGGSPLQNLIVRGYKETKVSAIKVTNTLDGGPVYMKKALSLEGTAQEILIRCADVIFQEMIPQFLKEIPTPQEQQGEPVIFKRRQPEDGKITGDMKPEKIYDYIRMLDAEGYPRAFIDFGDYRLCFEAANLSEDGESVEAKVIFQKRNE